MGSANLLEMWITLFILTALALIFWPSLRAGNPYTFGRRLCALPSLTFFLAGLWVWGYFTSDTVQKGGVDPVTIVGGLAAMAAAPILVIIGCVSLFIGGIVAVLESRWRPAKEA